MAEQSVEQPTPPSNTVEIRSPQGDSLEVNRHGGRIRLSLGNTKILTSEIRSDGKPAETHPCTPIFGKKGGEQFGLLQHGNMRNEDCAVTLENGVISIEHEITDKPAFEAPKSYPSGVEAKQRLSLEDGVFTCETAHTNNGDEKAPVSFAEHLYWDAPQGYMGTRVNGRDVTTLIESDAAIPLDAVNLIQIPGLPDIEFKQEGFGFLMLWVGKDPNGKPDKKYVCLEPSEGDPENFFGSPESFIEPKARRTNWFSISVKTKS
jgi:galactose mutarotase-like enzyme